MDSNFLLLCEFLSDWRDPSEIEEFLLPDTHSALAGTADEIENGSATVTIYIYKDRVDFYSDDEDVPEIPTEHFRQIIEAWRDFLRKKPLHWKVY